MAIGPNKSRIGSLMGVDMKVVNQPPAQPQPQTKAETSEPKPTPSATPAPRNTTAPTTVGGRPKFELIAGKEEKKVNFHCPEILYTAINLEAIKQKKTVKQFICEVLLEEMSNKYGFKVE